MITEDTIWYGHWWFTTLYLILRLGGGILPGQKCLPLPRKSMVDFCEECDGEMDKLIPQSVECGLIMYPSHFLTDRNCPNVAVSHFILECPIALDKSEDASVMKDRIVDSLVVFMNRTYDRLKKLGWTDDQ